MNETPYCSDSQIRATFIYARHLVDLAFILQYVDVFLLLVTDKPQRKDLFILDAIYIDRHHI